VALDLQAVLAHPVLLHSQPQVLAGDPSDHTVRWVHSSEIYDIAPLLRGGELLLTTGLGLEGRTPEERRSYIRRLAEADVAGVALELSRSFLEVPEEMVSEACRLDLPLLALRRVYPFVEVTERINSAILESSIDRLRHSEEVGRALSRVLALRRGVESLAAALAGLTQGVVELIDPNGRVVAAAVGENQGSDEPLSVPVVADGVLLGSLVLGSSPAAPPELMEAASDRAPEFFAIELLRSGQESLSAGYERREVIAGLAAGEPAADAALLAHLARSRVSPGGTWAGMVVRAAPGGDGLGVAHRLAHHVGATVLAADLGEVTCALLTWAVDPGADDLSQRLRKGVQPGRTKVALGPLVGVDALARSLRAARQALSTAGLTPEVAALVADELVIERLLISLRDRRVLEDLVEEQLGGLLRTANAQTSILTLERYFASGGSKAATARSLHLRRQSVHQRLARLSERLGYDVTAPSRHVALRLALAAYRVLDLESPPPPQPSGIRTDPSAPPASAAWTSR